jgi:gluconate 5-dehydrogenase
MTAGLFSLKGKVVLVTGACGYLGNAMCEGLAEAGASLALCSTRLEKAEALAHELTRRYDVPATGFQFDLQVLGEFSKIVGEIATSMGQLDCLVNNACYVKTNDIDGMTPEEWGRGFDGVAGSPFFLLQACLPHLEKTSGSIINIASMYGMVAPKPRNYADTPFGSAINYGAAKAALLQVTRYAAVYLAPRGIRVNAISPGPFPTPEVQKNSIFMDRLAQNVPLGRIGRVDEVKGAVVFLASDAASYVTGHNLVVDGGWTAW